MTIELKDKDASCYVCGAENPVGLHVPFMPGGAEGSRATYIAQAEHVGWPGLLHGGVLFALMDEAVSWALYYKGLRGVTAKAELRIRKPIVIGTPLVIIGSITKYVRQLVRTRAEVLRDDDSGEKLAELRATHVLIG